MGLPGGRAPECCSDSDPPGECAGVAEAMSATNEAQPPASSSSAVAELQGLYGPFTFPEKLLQKIWWHGDFDHDQAKTGDAKRVSVLHPGRWNHLGGPDFRGARIKLGDGTEMTGDVEVHLRSTDWDAHGHARDPAYDHVILHVVLFPPAPGHVTRGAGDREIPVLALLPLLDHDLEEYAAEDAVESLAGRPVAQIAEALAPLPPTELAAVIGQHADARLWQKVYFARLRVQRLGWEEACHHTALEILGYRFNRAPMLRVAAAFPLGAWNGIDPRGVFESEAAGWSLHGVRPANHPRNRLTQYAAWVRARPDWPHRLAGIATRSPRVSANAATGAVRREHGLAELRATWAAEICGNAVRGARFDNLVCDGFLPLLAVRDGIEVRELWYHWFAGDLPRKLLEALRQLEVFGGRTSPACHGAAQGLLGWLIEREQTAKPPPRAAI